MSVISKGSEDAAEENAVKSEPSGGKWKPKINRTHLKNSPYMSLFSDKSDQKKPDVNGQNDSTENKMDSPKKTIISLKSVKSSSCDSTIKGKESSMSTIIKLRKSSVSSNDGKIGDSGATATSSSADSPKKYTPITWEKSEQSASNVAPKNSSSEGSPKKKHKPITWP